MKSSAFSVVIPAYNAAETLGACLESLGRAMPAPAEILVYDDGSTDDTRAIARAHGARVLRNDGPNQGPARGRNIGAEAASTRTVVFVDADVAVQPGAPGLLAARVAREAGVVAAFGAYGARSPVKNYAGRYANLRHHHTHAEAPGEAMTFWSGLGAVDRAAFLRAGGFDLSYDRPCIEDVELGLRLREQGGRILLVPQAQGDHLKNWTIRQLWHTDVFVRALPWSKLMIEGRLGDTLNTGGREKEKSVLAHGVWASALVALFVPLVWFATLGFAAAYLWSNRRLLRLLGRNSRRLAVAGAALHWTYHLYASVAFALVLVGTGLRTQMRQRPRIRRQARRLRRAAQSLKTPSSARQGLLEGPTR
ncbi:glycosyltransferase family 2 protein [Parvularcula oceani]|uniref:glycosyltransferase family 2 protein n=1 Tax=Parvularcula oceani TaxID=1247963 RepID=UPI000691EB54|nr:glycosyltransferase [Parvularcula oceani]